MICRETEKIKYENELLEIFILFETNTFESKKESVIRYSKLKSIDFIDAFKELKEQYKIFNNCQTKKK